MSHKKCGQYNHRDNAIWDAGFEAGQAEALTAEDLRHYVKGQCSVVIVIDEGSKIECKIGSIMADTLEFTTIQRAIYHIKNEGKGEKP